MIPSSGTPKAPALSRGLDILKVIASAHSPPRFNEIKHTLELPQASCARFLRVLLDEGYVRKTTTGAYKTGPMFEALVSPVSTGAEFTQLVQVEIPKIVQMTHNTALGLFFDGAKTIVVAKETHPESIVMQELEAESTRFFDCPWGPFFWDSFDSGRREALLRQFSTPEPVEDRLLQWIQHYKAHGYVFDQEEVYKGVHRLAFPVLRGDEPVGAIGVGGTLASLPEAHITTLVPALKEMAQHLSRRISYGKEA
jgi:DNA-binding IclR family transcriptional regulator